MNHGFFGFPDIFNTQGVLDIKEFDTSGSYVIPTYTKQLANYGYWCRSGWWRWSKKSIWH
jgi:hypothetical protein